MTRLAIVVNRVRDVNAKMTTALVIRRAAQRQRVLLMEVGGFEMSDEDHLLVNGRWIDAENEAKPASWWKLPIERIDAAELDLLMIRTNPARDRERMWVHDVTMFFANLAQERGIKVVSDPLGLATASNKLFLSRLPEAYRPKTLVSRDMDTLCRYIEAQAHPVILKPLHGTHGRDVFRLLPDDLGNMRQMIDVLARTDYVMVQEYLPEAPQGDTRVMVLEGELLVVNGESAAIRRVPQGNDFRGNVSAGAKPSPTTLSDAQRAAIKAAGAILRQHRIFIAGLDFIGDRIVEINVFSPGGLLAAERYYKQDFTGRVLERLDAQLH
ncbi:MAG: hypothetical protein H6707_07325 [Deltaproteobacteria bacterium]|nr:hypothetical protein [Deltaproteobacteria bacterium]